MQLIEDYVDRETAAGRKQVEAAETAIKQGQEDMGNVEKVGWKTRMPETTLAKMLNDIWDSLSNLASSDDGEDGEDEDDNEEDPELGKLSKDDEPGWVKGTISKTIQHHMECFRQEPMKLDKWMQPGWGDPADYFHESNMKCGITELNVPAVIQPHMVDDAASSTPTTSGEPIETLDSVPGKTQMPEVISQPGCSGMRLGSRKPQTQNCIPSLPPDTAPDS